MNEKSLTEMSDDEIVVELQALRDRRAQARLRRASEVASPSERGVKEKKIEEISGSLGKKLDDIFGDEQ